MISVLVPSRARAKMLAESLKSLGIGDYEVLTWVDEDDPELDQYMDMHRAGDLEVMVGPRVGYRRFHEMINELAAHAVGDYLLLWNDDALMLSPDWVKAVENHDHPDIAVLSFSPDLRNNFFPVITRRMYEVMGHFSLSAHCDSWVQDIANDLGRHYYVPGVEVKHLREMVWDQTKAETQATYAETSPLHYSPEMVALMQADTAKLKQEIE